MVKTQGLMYVKVIINGHGVMAMVDTGATNSFVAEKNRKVLGLVLQPSTSHIKLLLLMVWGITPPHESAL